AVSSSLAFWLASPRPMLTVIFCNFGTAILFSQPKRFISAGTVSLLYFSYSRVFISLLFLVPYLSSLLIECRSAAAAGTHFLSIGKSGVSHAGMLAAAGTDNHHVRNVDWAFFFDDAALDVFPRIRPRVALDDRSMLDHYCVFLRVDRKHAPRLAGVFAGDDFHVVAFADTDGVPLGSFMSQCHCLPNLRSQRDDLGELFVAQLSCHGAEHACSHRFARIVDQNRGIVVKPDVRAILATPLFPHSNNHSLHDRALLDLTFRCRFFYRRGDDVAETSLQSGVAAHRHNAHQLPRAGIVGYRQPGSHLNHFVCSPV